MILLVIVIASAVPFDLIIVYYTMHSSMGVPLSLYYHAILLQSNHLQCISIVKDVMFFQVGIAVVCIQYWFYSLSNIALSSKPTHTHILISDSTNQQLLHLPEENRLYVFHLFVFPFWLPSLHVS